MNSCVNCAHAWVDKLEFRGKLHRSLRCGNESAGQRKDYAVAFGRGPEAVFVEREAPKWCPLKEDA